MLRISNDRSELDIEFVHRYLSVDSYWANGIPLATLKRALANSLCFGGFVANSQVAFARVVSDYATFANLVDVFVAPDHRGKGFGKALIEAVMRHPDLQGLRRFTLVTRDAHDLYKQFGFTPLARPGGYMERHFPDIYR